MKTQKATTSDVPTLATMNHRLIRDEGHRNPMGVLALAKRMGRWLRNGYQAWVFREGNRAVGYCLFRREREFLYIRQFYIEEKSRRKGFGARAFDRMRKNVWKKDKFLRLDVLVGNKRGILFWKKVGFKDYCLTMERRNP